MNDLHSGHGCVSMACTQGKAACQWLVIGAELWTQSKTAVSKYLCQGHGEASFWGLMLTQLIEMGRIVGKRVSDESGEGKSDDEGNVQHCKITSCTGCNTLGAGWLQQAYSSEQTVVKAAVAPAAHSVSKSQ